MHDMQDLLAFVFGIAITSGIGLLAWFIRQIGGKIENLYQSISELNKNMAVLIESHEWHRKEIDKLEKRVTYIENIQTKVKTTTRRR